MLANFMHMIHSCVRDHFNDKFPRSFSKLVTRIKSKSCSSVSMVQSDTHYGAFREFVGASSHFSVEFHCATLCPPPQGF